MAQFLEVQNVCLHLWYPNVVLCRFWCFLLIAACTTDCGRMIGYCGSDSRHHVRCSCKVACFVQHLHCCSSTNSSDCTRNYIQIYDFFLQKKILGTWLSHWPFTIYRWNWEACFVYGSFLFKPVMASFHHYEPIISHGPSLLQSMGIILHHHHNSYLPPAPLISN